MFAMIRNKDESGTSGTGVVLHGVVFPSGKCVVCWDTKQGPDSVSVFETFDEFQRIHIDQHPTNKTEIVWFKYRGHEKPKEVEALGL